MDNEEKYVYIPKEAQATLSQICKTKKSIFVYAVEAALISDQLLLLNRLSQLGKIGQHNVLAVTPRDFGDSRIPAKNLSDTYRAMLLPTDFGLLPVYHDDLDDWTNFVMAHSIYIYKNKFTLSNAIRGFCAASLINALASVPGVPATTNFIVANKLIKEDAMAASSSPGKKPSPEQRFKNSLAEYVQVYDYLEKTEALKVQTKFLQRLLSFCKQNNIELTLVNLPLTAENRALMKAGFYQEFSATLARIASENSTPYVDLSLDPNFADRAVFYDSAHMSKLGGLRLIEALAPRLCQSR